MLGLRVIVEWDGAVVEDRLFCHAAQVLVGAGALAQVPAPVAADRYVAFVRRGDAWELRAPAGVVRAIEVPGEPAVDGAQGCVRALAVGGATPARCGTLVCANGAISYELVVLAGERDRALWMWSAAALALMLVGASGLALVARLYGGPRSLPDAHRWAQMTPGQAERLRVRIGPAGAGATRAQGGTSSALHAARPTTAPPRPLRPPLPERPVVSGVDGDQAGALPPTLTGHGRPTRPARTLSRQERLERAEAALLTADLRAAVDDFSRADQEGALGYDELNWLGAAHYMQDQYDDAERAWSRARALDPGRPDAINNLATVAKRRGDSAGERALLDQALALAPDDCNASNNLALWLARQGDRAAAQALLARSDAACGGEYAYSDIQRAGVLALDHQRGPALAALERGLAHVDTMTPIKEFEVWKDLTIDPAFATLRDDPRFPTLLARYLPRAARGAR